MQLQKATRQKVKLRLSIASPTGFGKTAGALIIAHGMGYDWDKIAVIDTENESASLYAEHILPTGYKIGQFNTIPLQPPYTPEKYTEAIKLCEKEGMEVIIIDSVTHVWSGKGGLLESNTALGNNTFQNWAKTTPRYQSWLASILNSSCHVITTNRKKQGYSMTEVNGKKVVEKLGMEDQIRDGYDYEMTIAFEIINDGHLAKASKDRSSLFSEAPEFVITEVTGKLIKDWCEKGIDVVQLNKERLAAEITAAKSKLQGCENLPQLRTVYSVLGEELKHATTQLKDELKAKFEAAVKTADAPVPVPPPVNDSLDVEEIKSGIAGLKLCDSVEDLINFKKTLPAHVIESAEFIAAGNEIYNLIMAEKPEAGTAVSTA